MKVIGLAAALLPLLLCQPVSAQGSAPMSATGGRLTPFLTALSVKNVDASANWYQANFGFKLLEKASYPDYKVTIAFLERDGFRLELIELEGSVPRTLPGGSTNHASLRGIGKFGFMVDRLDPWVERLKTAGIKIEIGPISEPKRGLRSLIISDPDGNHVQLFERI